MQLETQEKLWTAFSTGCAVGAAILTRNAMKSLWRSVRHEDPPVNPALPEIRWSDAVAWSLAVGAAAGVARMLARRGAASGWRRLMHSPPPGIGA